MSQTKTVAMTSYKGGSGKSLSTVMLAWEAAGRGQRVLIVDIDPSQQAVEWLALANLSELRPLSAVYLDHNKFDLGDFVQSVKSKGDHDLIMIDTPANDRDSIAEALEVADLAIIPVNVGRSDIGMLGTTVKILERTRRSRPELLARFLINQSGFAPVKEAWTIEQCSRLDGVDIFFQRIPLRASYKDAPGQVPPKEAAYMSLYSEIQRMFTAQEVVA